MPRIFSRTLIAVALLAGAGAGVAAPDDPAGRLAGRALDDTGRLMAGVQVLLSTGWNSLRPLERQTDRRGRFVFNRLPESAEYLLVATKSGYLASIMRLQRLPATLDLVLRTAPLAGEEDRLWVLRLPGRDLLRQLQHGTGEAGVQKAVAEPAISARLEQRVGLSVAAADGTGGMPGETPDLGTRVALSGRAGGGGTWNSDARYSGSRVARAATGDWRRTTEMGLSGGADLSVGKVARLRADARFARQRLQRAFSPGEAENRAIGFDLESRLNERTLLDLHVRSVSARTLATEAESGRWHRQALGLTMARDLDLGDLHRLTASLALREFEAADGSRALLGRGAGRAGEAFWLSPDGTWAVLGLRDAVGLAPGVMLGFGAEVRRTDRHGTDLIPSVDLEWSPRPGTLLSTGLRFRPDPDDASGPLSMTLALTREIGSRTRFRLGLRQESLDLRDPFADGQAFAGVWSDGAALSRELEMVLDQAIGPVRGHLSYRYGEMQGRIAVPDPFEMIAARLEIGWVRYSTLEAGAHLPASDTHVSLVWRELVSTLLEPVRVVGVRVSQGLPASVGVPGDWRLLLDYEGIAGGVPFEADEEGRDLPTFVGRVSGGVAIRF